MMLGGYRLQSRYISLLTPPLRTKNFNGRLVNDDNIYRYRDISREQNYSPKANLFVLGERVCERKVIGGDQLESDLGARKLRPEIILR